MTIQGLHSYIQKNAKRAFRLLKAQDIKGLHIGVDGTLVLFTASVGMASSSEDLKSEEEFQIAVRKRWQQCLQQLLTLGALSVTVVFDGKERRPEKALTHKLRREQKDKNKARLEEKLKSENLTESERKKVQLRLSLMEKGADCQVAGEWAKEVGCQVEMAQHEADPVLAQMVYDGRIQAICSDDSDFLAYPYPQVLLLRNVMRGLERNPPVIECWSKKRVLEDLKMDPKTFLDFCVLVGCDYCPRAWLLGPTKAYKILDQYRSLDKYIQRCKRAYPNSDTKPTKKVLKLEPHAKHLTEQYIEMILKARSLFAFF